MAKVKVFGNINFEFDVKFNQTEDITIEAKGISANGKTTYIGTGSIEKIHPKAFSFVASRIEYFLKKHNAYMLDLNPRDSDDDKAIKQELKKQGFGFLLDGPYGNAEAVEKMLETKYFMLSEFGMRFYLNKLHAKKKQ